jgi:HSP20 family protein
MLASFSDPFVAMFALQRALDARIASDWMGRGTAAIGSYPPINIFQKQGEDPRDRPRRVRKWRLV